MHLWSSIDFPIFHWIFPCALNAANSTTQIRFDWMPSVNRLIIIMQTWYRISTWKYLAPILKIFCQPMVIYFIDIQPTNVTDRAHTAHMLSAHRRRRRHRRPHDTLHFSESILHFNSRRKEEKHTHTKRSKISTQKTSHGKHKQIFEHFPCIVTLRNCVCAIKTTMSTDPFNCARAICFWQDKSAAKFIHLSLDPCAAVKKQKRIRMVRQHQHPTHNIPLLQLADTCLNLIEQ